MIPNPRAGNVLYLGVTRCGKTRKAYEDLLDDVRQTGRPFLVIDPMPAENFKALEHQRTIEEVLERMCGQRRYACITPRGQVYEGKLLRPPEQVGRILRALRELGGDRGGYHVLYDECGFHMSPSIDDGVSEAARGWWHGQLTIRYVSQRPRDIHRDIFSCDPETFVFRITNKPDLERLEEEFEIDRAEIQALPKGQWKRIKKGFADEHAKDPPGAPA